MAKKISDKEGDKERNTKAQQTVKENNKTTAEDNNEDAGFVGDEEEKQTGASEQVEDKNDQEPDSAEEKKEDMEVRLAEFQDKYLRLSAEFDNYRKRTLKERIELTRSAGESLLLSLLPVMDDFERAMTLMETTADCESIKEGVGLIYNKMQGYLRQNGVKEMESLGKDFDTDLHEAVTKIPAADKKQKGKVVDVIQKGYYLNDKILRYAKVVIGE
ncbi:MAG: nucleotide exchange factor GrpE [Bacteroidota bacterium]